MPSIRASDVKLQLARDARVELLAAAGANTLISRGEQRGLAPELERAVDEVRTAGGAGTRVSVDAAARAFELRFGSSIDAVNQRQGPGQVWLSRAELEALLQRDPAVGARAKKAWELLAAGPAPAFSPAQFERELAGELSFEFESSFASEGGQRMSVVRVPGPFGALDAATFKAAFGFTSSSPDHKLERDVPAAGVLAELTASVVQPTYSAAQEQDARKIASMIGSLRGARAFVLGEDGTTAPVHPTYIVGLAPDGSLIGIKTGVVWT